MNKRIRVNLTQPQQQDAWQKGYIDLTQPQALSVRGILTAYSGKSPSERKIPEGTPMCPCGKCKLTLARAMKRHPARIRLMTSETDDR